MRQFKKPFDGTKLLVLFVLTVFTLGVISSVTADPSTMAAAQDEKQEGGDDAGDSSDSESSEEDMSVFQTDSINRWFPSSQRLDTPLLDKNRS